MGMRLQKLWLLKAHFLWRREQNLQKASSNINVNRSLSIGKNHFFVKNVSQYLI